MARRSSRGRAAPIGPRVVLYSGAGAAMSSALPLGAAARTIAGVEAAGQPVVRPTRLAGATVAVPEMTPLLVPLVQPVKAASVAVATRPPCPRLSSRRLARRARTTRCTSRRVREGSNRSWATSPLGTLHCSRRSSGRPTRSWRACWAGTAGSRLRTSWTFDGLASSRDIGLATADDIPTSKRLKVTFPSRRRMAGQTKPRPLLSPRVFYA